MTTKTLFVTKTDRELAAAVYYVEQMWGKLSILENLNQNLEECLGEIKEFLTELLWFATKKKNRTGSVLFTGRQLLK